MLRIFITGTADGLGQMAARLLIADGHQVVLHARSEARANEALKAAPGAETAVSADLSSIGETIQLAEKVNKLGHFDAIIHNAGIGYQEPRLIQLPQRLIYLSSGLHREGNASLEDLTWDTRRWNGYQAYSDTKLHDVLLAFAVAKHYPNLFSNALEPGWVATKMGGAGAPDSLADAPKTQVWLAVSNDEKALVNGKYFYHQKRREYHPAADNADIQEGFLAACERISGVKFPKGIK